MTLDAHQAVHPLLALSLGSVKLRSVGGEVRHRDLVAKIVLDGIGKHEVTVGKTLHEGRSTEAVCAVVREVTFTDSEETLD